MEKFSKVSEMKKKKTNKSLVVHMYLGIGLGNFLQIWYLALQKSLQQIWFQSDKRFLMTPCPHFVAH